MSKKKDQAPVKEIRDQDLEELLNQLTTEQLEELHTDLIDPDDSMVPPSDRCRYKTDKLPTGPYQRKLLLEYMAKIAREDKDWDEAKPYTKETRGKVWKAPVEDKIKLDEDEAVSTEWDDVLNSATEAELVDLAAILGFHGMLNQVQYHQAFVEGKDRDESSGFQGVAKCADLKVFEDDPPNDVDVAAALEKVKADDPQLKELNLNNVEDISVSQLIEFAEALETNTHLEKLHMANTFATNKVARTLAASLLENKTLKVLNIESNYIAGAAIAELIEAINKQQVVQELRVANQSQQTLGVRAEMAIAQQMKENVSILKFSIFPEVQGAKILINRYVERNVDNLRRSRMGKELDVPKEDETPYYLRQLVEQQNAANKKVADAKKDEQKAKAAEAKQPTPKAAATKTPAPAAAPAKTPVPPPTSKTPVPGKTAATPPGKTAPAAAKTPTTTSPAKTAAATPAKTAAAAPAKNTAATPSKTADAKAPVGKDAPKSPAVPGKTAAAAPKSPAPVAKTPAAKAVPASAAAKTPVATAKTPAATAKTPPAAKKPASSSSDSSSSDSEDDKKKAPPAKTPPAKTPPAKVAPAAAAKKPAAKKSSGSSSSSGSDSEDDDKAKAPPAKSPPGKTQPVKIPPGKTPPAKKKSSSSSSSDSSSEDDKKKKLAPPAKTAPPPKKVEPPKNKKDSSSSSSSSSSSDSSSDSD